MNKEICDEEFNKYFKEETNKQTFKIKMEEPMKLIINYDYYFLLLKKLERLESKIKMLEKYKDDYKRMKDNFDSKVDVIENLHKEIDRLNKEYERIYNENCKLRENHNINDITLLDENERLNRIIDNIFKFMQNKYDNSDLTGFTISFMELQDLKALKENK